MSLSLEELQEVFDEMRIGKVVISMKEKDITEQQLDLKNAVLDSGGYDETDDYFFLPSRSEIYGGVEVSGVDEGTAYPYYADYSDLSAAGAGADSNRIKYRAGAAQNWWLRSPTAGYGYYPRLILPAGTVSSYYAGNSFGAALACNII